MPNAQRLVRTLGGAVAYMIFRETFQTGFFQLWSLLNFREWLQVEHK